MAVLLTNRLNGDVGTQPDSASLAASGDPVGISSPARSQYDDQHTLIGLSTIRVGSGLARHSTPRIDFAIPDSGDWYIRFYCWTPDLPLGEVSRMVLWRIGPWNFTFLPTSAGNISMRAYGSDDLGVAETNPALDGTAVAANQWVRWELHYDSANTELVVECYDGHSTTDPRIFVYSGMDLSGQTVQLLTGYRFRRRWLTWGQTGTVVEEYQNKLLDLGYDLGAGGADAIYGQDTANAFEAFQADVGLPVGAGQAEDGVGPEDLAALDQQHNEFVNGTPLFPETVWLSHLEVDDAQAPGPVQALSGTASVSASSGAAADGTVISGGAAGVQDAQASAAASGFGSASGTAQASAQAAVDNSGFPIAYGTASASAEASSSADGDPSVVDVPVGFRYRLMVYDPNGPVRGQIPLPLSFQLAVPLNDMPSLMLEYVKGAPGADLLDTPCEVAVEVSPQNVSEYQEYPGMRFLRLRDQHDMTDRTQTVRYTMPSYAWQLRKIRNINRDAFDDEGKRTFTVATPGEIIRAFILESQDRGNVPGLQMDFSAGTDSAGQVWPDRLNISFNAGQDLWSILDALSAQGAVDWRIHRRTLQLYVPETVLHTDRTDRIVLFAGRDFQEAPDDTSYEDLASRVLVAGDEGAYLEASSASSLHPWGMWEDFISQGGVSDQGTMQYLAQSRLEITRQERVQRTRKIAFTSTRYLPFIHYRPGDEILAPDVNGVLLPQRVRQISITSISPHGVEGSLILNDRFIEKELLRDRRIASVTGGSGGSPGGGGGQPGEDTRRPAAPENLLLATATYINQMGEARGQITASWSEVDRASDGTEMSMSGYEVWVRRAAANEQFERMATTDSQTDVDATMSPFEIEETYEVRVRAIGRNNRAGLFSAVQAIVVQRDETPPPPPSDPQLSTRLGTIRVFWDGLDEIGVQMPIDFDYVRVHMADSPAGPFEVVDNLYREGVAVVVNQPYGQDRFFRFTALDRSGNESDPSGVQSIATEQLVPGDVTPGSIGYELLEEGAVRDDILADEAVRNRHIAAGEITGGKIRAYSIFADRLAVGTTQNLYVDANFEDPGLNAVRAVGGYTSFSASWEVSFPDTHPDVEGRNGALYTVVSLPAGTGPRMGLITGADDTIAGPVTRSNATVENAFEVGEARTVTSTVDMISRGLNTALLQFTVDWFFRSTDGTWFTHTDFGVGSITGDNAESILSSVRVDQLPSEVTHFIPRWRTGISNGGDADVGAQLFVYRPRVVAMVGTTLIEDGAVTTDKIFANAITADKIDVGAVQATHIASDAITTDKLAANAITAKHTITGALIQTEATVNRGIKLNSDGLFAYDSNGNQTMSVNATSGAVTTVGTYMSGYDGQNRVLISPSANYLNQAGIRLFSGAGGAIDSSLFIDDGSGTGGWDPYTVALTGAELVRNDSGRTDLALRYGNNGGARLASVFGSYSGIGIEFEQWNMSIRGRKISAHHSYDLFIWGRTSNADGHDDGDQWHNWTYTYGASAPNGGKLCIPALYLASSDTGVNYDCSAFVRYEQTQDHVQLAGRTNTTIGRRVQFITMWVDTSAWWGTS